MRKRVVVKYGVVKHERILRNEEGRVQTQKFKGGLRSKDIQSSSRKMSVYEDPTTFRIIVDKIPKKNRRGQYLGKVLYSY